MEETEDEEDDEQNTLIDSMTKLTTTDDGRQRHQHGVLLALRQKFKKVASNRVRAESHRTFVAYCDKKKIIPRIKTTCQALMREQTEVERRFAETTAAAEIQYLAHLLEHYERLAGSLAAEEGLPLA